MLIRITKTPGRKTTLLRVEGRLDRESLSVLEAECRSAAGGLVLDLSGVTYADSTGVEFLDLLVQRGAQLQEVTPFLELLLKEAGSSEPRTPRRAPDRL